MIGEVGGDRRGWEGVKGDRGGWEGVEVIGGRGG